MLGPNANDANDSEALMLTHHRHPMSIIYVVEPAYFRFSVQPVGEDAHVCMAAARQTSHSSRQSNFNHWTLETGKEYNLQLELYDQNNHRIYPADNVRISMAFPDGALEVLKSSKNGTSHVVVARKTGAISVKATLEGVMTSKGELKLFSHPITGSQELVAYSPVQISPKYVNLAWDVSVNVSEGYTLTTKGGSGDYIWTVLSTSELSRKKAQPVEDDSIITVSQEGVLYVKGIGSALVVVSDLRNPEMCSHSNVRVNRLSNLGFTRGRVEVYLPRNSLFDSEIRLLSTLSARSADSDATDLLLLTPINQHPLKQHEKMNNSVLSVGLEAVDVDGNPITFCHKSPITVRPVDSSIVKVLPGESTLSPIFGSISLCLFRFHSPFPGLHHLPPSAGVNYSNICAFVRIIGIREGFTKLEAYFVSGEHNEEQRANVQFPVAVYKDISFLPNNAVIAVAVGSSRRISV